jgi:hypothetical protein
MIDRILRSLDWLLTRITDPSQALMRSKFYEKYPTLAALTAGVLMGVITIILVLLVMVILAVLGIGRYPWYYWK